MITNFAGSGTSLGDGGPATAASVPGPAYGVFDSSRNYYFAQSFGSPRIRKIDNSGIVITVAGNGTSGFSGDGGPATAAQFHQINGLASDLAGNLYVSDLQNYRIRKVDAISHIIRTIAGTGTTGTTGDGGPATAANVVPCGICVDTGGNLYFLDNFKVRKITTSGIITTVAGNGTGGITGFSGDGGAATAAQIGSGAGICVDDSGNLYFAGSGGWRIRKVNLTTGIISTIAGNGISGTYNGEGIHADSAQFTEFGICRDWIGNIYISDYGNHRIRKISTLGIMYTVAGNGAGGYSGDGGPATAAQINHPEGIAVDLCGNLYIADEVNNRIRKVTNPSIPSVSITTPTASAIGSTVTITASITGGCCASYSYLWMNKGVVFATTTAPSTTYTKTNGIDSITVKAVGCGDTTVSSVHVVLVDKTGTSPSPSKGGVTCYPNPVHSELVVDAGVAMQSVSVANLLGQVVYFGGCNGEKERVVDVRELPVGVYFVRVVFEDGSVGVERFVKNN